MMRIKPWVAGVGLCAAAAPAFALPVLLDFEEVPFGAFAGGQILNYYGSGGTVPQFGVKFEDAPADNNAAAGDLARATVMQELVPLAPQTFDFRAVAGDLRSLHPLNPFPVTNPNLQVMNSGGTRDDGSFALMTSQFGIDLSTLTFWYSSQQAGTEASGARVEAFNATGSLGFVPLQAQADAGAPDGEPCGDETATRFCNWTQVVWAGAGAVGATTTGFATGLRFYNDGSANTLTLYDNIQFSTAAAVPEPSTYALMALGLAGIALISRRRREL